MRYNTVKLGDYLYIKGRIGWKGLKKNEYLEKSNYRIINGESLTDDGIDWDKAGYITQERYEESPEIMLQPNDILLSKDGTIGKIGFVEELEYPTTVASGIFVIRNLQPEIINTRFIYNFLCSTYFKNFITMRTEGSVIPHLYQKDFVDLDFPLPTMDEQNKIVKILDDISNKIDLNKKIKINLKEQMISIYLNEINNISVERPLEEILEFFDSKRKPLSSREREKMKKIYPYYGATDIVDYVEDFIFEGIYILISEDGANVVDKKGRPLVQYTRDKFWLNNHAHIVKGKNGFSEGLIYTLLLTTNMQSIVTGAAQPKINQANLKSFQVNVPCYEHVITLSKIIEPMFAQLIECDRQNQDLLELKKSLLSRLMSGILNVSKL